MKERNDDARYQELSELLDGQTSSEHVRRRLDDVSDDRELSLLYLAAQQSGRAVDTSTDRAESAMGERRERMAKLLFGAPRPETRKRRRPLAWGLAAGLLAAGLAGIMLMVPGEDPPGTKAGFRAKGVAATDGSTARSPRVHIYLATKPRYQRLSGTLPRSVGLAFAYSNEAPKTDRLMVFALDEDANVYWYYPAFTEPRSDPSAIPVRVGRDVELPDTIRHRYRGKILRIFAIFGTAAHGWRVSQIEDRARKLQEAGTKIRELSRFPQPRSMQQTWLVEVVP